MRASGAQLCSYRKASPTASGDITGMRRGGAHMFPMYKSSVSHAGNLAVVRCERQKRHGSMHHSFVSTIMSLCLLHEQRQFCSHSREMIRLCIVFKPICSDISHAIAMPGESSRYLVERHPSVTPGWCQAV
ncbi:hypothetical protein TRVL_02714 [Trypanosoma vivax]|nr:hypothetical protein TRVL_02714 [Trypanosoma vivax]